MAQQQDIAGLIESWTRTQREIWDQWMETLRHSGAGAAQLPTLYQGMESWRSSVNQTLDTQAEALKAWASEMRDIKGATPEAKHLADEGAKMVEQWTNAQRGLWQQWFDMMGKTLEGSGGKAGTDQFKQLMAGWEQAGKQMQELQRAWMAQLSPGNNKKK